MWRAFGIAGSQSLVHDSIWRFHPRKCGSSAVWEKDEGPLRPGDYESSVFQAAEGFRARPSHVARGARAAKYLCAFPGGLRRLVTRQWLSRRDYPAELFQRTVLPAFPALVF